MVGVPVAPPSRTPSRSTPRKTSENIPMLSSTSTAEKRVPGTVAARWLDGSARRPIANTTSPNGTLKAKSQGHEATDRIEAATDGPATEAVATTIELIAIPRPSCDDG